MRMAMVGTWAAVVMVVMGLVVVGVPVGYFLFVYGCGREEERLGEALAGDPVLGEGVEGVRAEESYQGCDDDDLFVVAGKSYRYGGDRKSVLAHYREAAPAHGWRYRTNDCFTKSIDGAVASLTLHGPADGSLQVEIVAVREDPEPWC
ncbi:hypothetical protein WBG99_19485 [Streptomyces sp. TG1A-60]|uniref:hypothetical protein n=1 Tax=Streptomyces sp. TG1A-60 TaxID=3129111 RepID=UPI0030D2C23A